jgi:hypothetical protein
LVWSWIDRLSSIACFIEISKMANPLAQIHGTEEDKVNCVFFSNFGACHYGNECHHWHNKPASSPTILMKHLYRHPMATESTVAAAKNPESITED